MLTTGVVPNAPLTFTDAFALELLAAALELELALALGFDEPQPAMTRQASKGIRVIARRRRMKNLNGDGRCWPRGDELALGGRPPGTPR
jgi:hypothetical protein